jgi:TfoX/Sxy family transcriptional regulator of competence genes
VATEKTTVEFILGRLGNPRKFSARPMFGEYALYADEKVVGLICDDQLYVKILPASKALAKMCEKDSPYPGAKPHYVIEEAQLSSLEALPDILLEVAKAIPVKKKTKKKKR